ncbi:uncharacterized protein LOC141648425 [Silene latifolia]|uniref:uncharacterized protein LOC141648425 n=1 Tax=Silene latifolia TaxID=37657 RepID=UPI003D773258
MNTMEKLHNLNISEEDTYRICRNGTETIDHLFFACPYSRKVMVIVGDWLGLLLPYQDLMEWRLRITGSKMKQGIINATINACLYHIWNQRNRSRIELSLLRPNLLALQIIEEMRRRVSAGLTAPVKNMDRSFIQSITGGEGG